MHYLGETSGRARAARSTQIVRSSASSVTRSGGDRTCTWLGPSASTAFQVQPVPIAQDSMKGEPLLFLLPLSNFLSSSHVRLISSPNLAGIGHRCRDCSRRRRAGARDPHLVTGAGTVHPPFLPRISCFPIFPLPWSGSSVIVSPKRGSRISSGCPVSTR